MSLHTKIIANTLFPLHEYLKGHTTTDVFNAMEKSQWLSPEAVKQLQLQRMQKFLITIGRTVPYYRNLFSRLEFDPTRISSLSDLRQLPLMGKPEIRANTEALKAEGAKHLKRFNTGGSSGEPLIFYLGNERVSHDVAAKRRATRWWGVDIGDPEIVVWGSPIELGAQDRVRLLRDKLFRTELLSAFEMSETNLARFVQHIQRSRPRMLFGYPSSLALIADYAVKHHYQLDSLGVRVVFVTSERLYEHQRNSIENAFGCPVANGYGGRDAGFIAHQCPSGSLHVTDEDIVLEIVGPAGDVLPAGESGEIVVTHLSTSDFPFVRYRTGDMGRLSSERCQCGRGLAVLDEVHGRTTDFVVATDGTRIHGLALIYILRDLPGVASFKITQISLSTTKVQIVKSDSTFSIDEHLIVSQFRKRLGDSVEVAVEYVDCIPREKSGKYRYVTSNVSPLTLGA